MAQVNQQIGGNGGSGNFDRCFYFFCEDRHDGFDRNNNFDGTTVVQNVGGNEAQSGAVTTPFTATNSGDNSNQCASALQFGNTGNNQPAQGVLQFDSESGGIGLGGGSFNFAPSNTQTCNQTVQQSAAASSGIEYVPVKKVEYVPVKKVKPAKAVATTGGTLATTGGGKAIASTGGTLATSGG